MGMVACFAATDAATLRGLQADPGLIQDFLYPDDGEGEPPHYVDLDKGWHCIHFMLVGEAEGGEPPLSWAILGGDEVGDEVGYGPARFLQPDRVRAVATALSSMDDETFKRRFEPHAMQAADVYLSEMCVRDGDEALEYLLENYRSLVAFYRGAADRGDGAILWVS